MLDKKPGIYGFFGTNRWLSNFGQGPAVHDGIVYPKSENAFQAAKTLDLEQRKQFLTCTAKEAKHLGYKVDLRPDWEEVKVYIMGAILLDKFTRNLGLKKKLLATEDLYLEETNSWQDTFWGVCNNKGKNNLGKLLMIIRERISL